MTPPLYTAGSEPQETTTIGDARTRPSFDLYGIDWLSFTGPKEATDDVLDRVLPMEGCDFEVVPPLKGYAEAVRFESGVRLDKLEKRTGRWRLDVQGRTCTRHGLDRLSPFIGDLIGFGAKATRVDIRRDLWGWPTLIDEVIGGCERKTLRGARQWTPIVQRTCEGDWTGHGVYLGSRKSDVLVRLYDKGLEQSEPGKGTKGIWLRWEVQYRDERADKLVQMIAAREPAQLHGLIFDACVYPIDFVGGTRGQSLDRGDREPFWQEFCEGSRALELALDPRTPTTFAGHLAYIGRMLAPFQAACTEHGIDPREAIGIYLQFAHERDGTRKAEHFPDLCNAVKRFR